MTTIYKSQTHAASEALGLWEPKRTLTLDAARQHSARVKFLRRLLVLLTLILGGVVLWIYSQRSTETLSEIKPSESARMMNPRFSGRTGDGLPYKLTADEAVRLNHTESEVDLINPVLEFFREPGADISIVTALSGTYDDVSQILNLRNNVDLKTDDGNHCVTNHARIFTIQQRIVGDEPIRCDGNFGIITGQTYEILDNYEVFKFKDGMTAMLDNKTTEVTSETVTASAGSDTANGENP